MLVNNLLTEYTYGEKASIAGITSIEGILVVFAVLAILWGCVELLHLVVSKIENRKKVEVVEESQEETNDEAVIAVVTAAVAAQMEAEGNKNNFRVTSVKRTIREPHKPIKW